MKVLFEAKTEVSTSAIYEAIGQLLGDPTIAFPCFLQVESFDTAEAHGTGLAVQLETPFPVGRRRAGDNQIQAVLIEVPTRLTAGQQLADALLCECQSIILVTPWVDP